MKSVAAKNPAKGFLRLTIRAGSSPSECTSPSTYLVRGRNPARGKSSGQDRFPSEKKKLGNGPQTGVKPRSRTFSSIHDLPLDCLLSFFLHEWAVKSARRKSIGRTLNEKRQVGPIRQRWCITRMREQTCEEQWTPWAPLTRRSEGRTTRVSQAAKARAAG
jgi:hypothetical protein